MYAATAKATALERPRAQPQIIDSSPNVATPSLSTCEVPLRTVVESITIHSPNIACASSTPLNAPSTCAKR